MLINVGLIVKLIQVKKLYLVLGSQCFGIPHLFVALDPLFLHFFALLFNLSLTLLAFGLNEAPNVVIFVHFVSRLEDHESPSDLHASGCIRENLNHAFGQAEGSELGSRVLKSKLTIFVEDHAMAPGYGNVRHFKFTLLAPAHLVPAVEARLRVQDMHHSGVLALKGQGFQH